MKPRITLFLLLSVAFTLISCGENDLYVEKETQKTIDELNIPSNFDWNMIANVSCNFTTATTTPLKVYTNKDCNDNALIAEYVLEPGMEAPALSVSLHTTKLYVKVGDGAATEVLVENGVASFDLPVSRAQNKDQLPGEYDESTNCIYFPSKEGFATVMFEDYFPTKGDYDFNDFVAKYSYVAHLSKQQGNGKDVYKLHVKSLDFKVKVVALGGQYRYKPHLRVLGMKVNNKNGFKGEGATILTGKNNDPIISIDGYTQKPEGAYYLNTKPEETIVPLSVLKDVTFSIIANNEGGTGVKQGDLKFDFFLKGTGHGGKTYEIHQRGFEPVDADCYPEDASGLGSTYYTTAENLVWGFTVPADIKHATEETDFTKAYSMFAEWAESGGTQHVDWYTKGIDEDCLFHFPAIVD